MTNGLNVNFYFGGTSLLIVVGVAMDTVNQSNRSWSCGITKDSPRAADVCADAGRRGKEGS